MRVDPVLSEDTVISSMKIVFQLSLNYTFNFINIKSNGNKNLYMA